MTANPPPDDEAALTLAEDLVSRWHGGGHVDTPKIQDFMRLTWDEYAAYAKDAVLPADFLARHEPLEPEQFEEMVAALLKVDPEGITGQRKAKEHKHSKVHKS